MQLLLFQTILILGPYLFLLLYLNRFLHHSIIIPLYSQFIFILQRFKKYLFPFFLQVSLLISLILSDSVFAFLIVNLNGYLIIHFISWHRFVNFNFIFLDKYCMQPSDNLCSKLKQEVFLWYRARFLRVKILQEFQF
jgi:hypothetical protein